MTTKVIDAPPFPQQVGFLVLVSVLSETKARYRCTFEKDGKICGREIVRNWASVQGAVRQRSRSACKKCGKHLKTQVVWGVTSARWKT